MTELWLQTRSMLENIANCYISRDKNSIKQLSDLLFHNEYQPIIIGTSNSEWCFGIKESEQIFLDDWEGWGNVTFDMSSVSCGQVGDMGWFCIKAGVEYVFQNSGEDYLSYMNLVSDIAKSEKTPLARMSEINWFLSHLLHTRPDSERKYIWDLSVTGIVQNIAGIYKIRVMQFSIPVLSAFPDVRIDSGKEEREHFESERSKVSDYGKKTVVKDDSKIRKLVARILSEDAHIRFARGAENLFLGLDGIHRSGAEFVEYLSSLRHKGMNAKILPEDIVLNQVGDTLSFCGIGIIERQLSLDSELDAVLKNIEYYSSLDNKKDALFKLRRDLSLSLKEASMGDKHSAPFRFEGIGRLDINEKLIIKYAQISYPFNWILEQKTDASIEIMA